MNSKDFIGGNLQELWKELLGKNRDDAIVKAITTDYDAYKQAHKPPYQKLLITEVNSCLEQLKKQGIKLAVASNSKRQDVLLALETTQIKDYFEIILAREDVSRGKPYPDIYNKAVQKLGLQKTTACSRRQPKRHCCRQSSQSDSFCHYRLPIWH